MDNPHAGAYAPVLAQGATRPGREAACGLPGRVGLERLNTDQDQTVREAIVAALRDVKEPESGRDVLALELVRGMGFAGGVARISFELPARLATAKLQEVLRRQTEAALRGLEGVREVQVEFCVVERWSTDVLPGVKYVVAVGAGKGGVGKSTLSLLAAVGLQRMGLKVGLLDADVYGPSLPKLTGTEQAQPEIDDRGRVLPPEFDGIKLISMGHLVPPDEAVIWRGPLAQRYVREFLDRGAWGELDYLIVDLPPGTGDIPLTLAQSIPLTGVVVVCTPQDVALIDVVKAVRMFRKLGVDVLGMVENMSYYVCPQCQARHYLFGERGAERASGELGVPFLGGIPLHAAIREYGDQGKPAASFTQISQEMSSALEQVVRRWHEEVERHAKWRTPLPQLRVGG